MWNVCVLQIGVHLFTQVDILHEVYIMLCCLCFILPTITRKTLFQAYVIWYIDSSLISVDCLFWIKIVKKTLHLRCKNTNFLKYTDLILISE
jgi:hypothetical protein